MKSFLKSGIGRPNINGICIYKNLTSEAYASRFASKTGKCDRKFLIQAFNTYAAHTLKKPYKLCEFGVFEKVVCTIEKCIRKIEK